MRTTDAYHLARSTHLASRKTCNLQPTLQPPQVIREIELKVEYEVSSLFKVECRVDLYTSYFASSGHLFDCSDGAKILNSCA